jgi:hypothetical protein
MKLGKALPVVVVALFLVGCNLNIKLPQVGSAGTPASGTTQAVGSSTAPAAFFSPTLAITGNSNCRSGPGGSFKLVTAFTAGTTLDIVGKDTATNYWQVKIPGSDQTCWVWGNYAVASGSVDSIPDSGAAPSGSGGPAMPGSWHYTYTCPGGNLTTSLSWSDSADNETGYRVYRFDQLVADLPANSTSYTDVVTVSPGAPLQYSIEAYNGAGTSGARVITFACQ